MSLLSVALRVAAHKPQPFTAPIPVPACTVFTLQAGGIPLHVNVRGAAVGWWTVHPDRKNKIGDPAQEWERIEYLRALPRFYVIACFPCGEQQWIVVPYSHGDAEQRGWHNAAPRVMYLIHESIQPYDILSARMMGDILLYEETDLRLGMQTLTIACQEADLNHTSISPGTDWRNAHSVIYDWQAKAEAQARQAMLAEQLSSTKNKMKFLLEFMGARLVDMRAKGNRYMVEWTDADGHSYTMPVTPEGRIIVVGICMAGTDSRHNLSSVVYAMEEARRLHRFDLDRDPDEDDDYDD